MKTELLGYKIRGKIEFLGGKKETRGWGKKSSKIIAHRIDSFSSHSPRLFFTLLARKKFTLKKASERIFRNCLHARRM
jgi:hypothetical protein